MLMAQQENFIATETHQAADHAVREKRRRETLGILREASEPMAIADIAQDLFLDGRASPESDADFEGIERRYIQLYHVDVPKMVQAGLVEYDQERKVVSVAE